MQTEKEKTLTKEVMRLDSENEELKRKLKIAEEFNFKYYRQNQELSYYIRQMERH